MYTYFSIFDEKIEVSERLIIGDDTTPGFITPFYPPYLKEEITGKVTALHFRHGDVTTVLLTSPGSHSDPLED